MFTPLETLVLATLAYTAQFDYPLSRAEIGQRLLSLVALKTIGVKSPKKPSLHWSTLTQKKLSQTIKKLLAKKILVETEVALNSRHASGLKTTWLSLAPAWSWSEKFQLVNLFSSRKTRQKLAERRRPEWLELQQMLTPIPWVLAAAVTGSAAMANGTKKSDLDVLIVAAPGRLWLARLCVLILTWWHQHRTPVGWCFNLWLEPSELGLPPQRQGVYEAYELWQCYWVVDKAAWRLAWFDRNAWFRKFLPLADLEPKFLPADSTISRQALESDFLPSGLGNLANSLAYLIQVHYRRWRHGEALSPRRQAFLHAPDFRATIYTRWQHQLKVLDLIH